MNDLFLVVSLIIVGLLVLVLGLGALYVLLTDPKGFAYSIGRTAQSVLSYFMVPTWLLRRSPQRVEEAGGARETKEGLWEEFWAGLLLQEPPSHKTWPITRGKILSSRVNSYRTGGSGESGYVIHATLIFYSYRAAKGRQYEGYAVFQGHGSYKKAEEWVQHNPPGTEIAVRYNPERPENSALAGLPDDPIPVRDAPLLGSLAIGTSPMRPQYPGPETDYVVQWYALQDTPLYWGSLSANNGILTCVRCSKARPLGPCPNCGYEQQFFRNEGDENWVPAGPGYSPLKGVEGYVRCHNCTNAWHFWTCECGTRNNIHQSIGWKEHIIAENPIAGRVGKTTKPTREQ